MSSSPGEQAADFVRRFASFWEAPTDDGLATERVGYFDSAPVVAALAGG